MDFKVGDEIWWFKLKNKDEMYLEDYHKILMPDDIELVHDQIKNIAIDVVECWHSVLHVNEIWGKSRFEAWNRLKDEIEKWGALDGTN